MFGHVSWIIWLFSKTRYIRCIFAVSEVCIAPVEGRTDLNTLDSRKISTVHRIKIIAESAMNISEPKCKRDRTVCPSLRFVSLYVIALGNA
jgi:hypothetical protein